MEDIKVISPRKRTKRGYYLYDIVKEARHKDLLKQVKDFLYKYYQELTYQEMERGLKTLYNVNLTTNDIKNLALSVNLKPKNIDSSSRKFVKKEFNDRASRGLWLTYFDYKTFEELRMKPN